MIHGIGVDRIAISRVASSLERFGERFVQRVFTAQEYEQAKAKGNVARRLAMLFAAKEAVSKALGTGFRKGIAMHHIETIHQASGKPEVILHAAALTVAKEAGINRVHVSLTDDDGVALAFAVAESTTVSC